MESTFEMSDFQINEIWTRILNQPESQEILSRIRNQLR